MQSASDTPSSHLWAQSCPADQRGVGCGWDRRANPDTKGHRLAQVPAARDRPAGYHERKRNSPVQEILLSDDAGLTFAFKKNLMPD